MSKSFDPLCFFDVLLLITPVLVCLAIAKYLGIIGNTYLTALILLWPLIFLHLIRWLRS